MKWKISSKIMVAIMISSAALAAIIGNIALFQAGNVIEQSVLDQLQTKAESYSNEFSRTTERVEGILDTYTSSITVAIDEKRVIKEKDEYIKIFQDEVLLPLTMEIAKNTDGILGIYFDIDPSITPGLSEEDSVYGAWFLDRQLTGKIKREDMEKKKHFYKENKLMFWYYDPILKGTGVWSKPYKDIYTGYYMVSYNKPVYLNGQLFGVAGIDIVFEDIMEMINNIKIGETGYGYLLDNNLDLIVHPKMEIETLGNVNLNDFDKKQYSNLVSKVTQQASGVADIGYGYNKKIAGFAHMTNGYLVVIEANSGEIMEGLNRVSSIIDAIMLLGILIAALAAYILGKFISRPLERLGKMIKRMKHFDFSSEINDIELVNTNSDSGMMIVELSNLRESVNNSIIMFRNNSSSINMNLEQMEKYLARIRNLIERIEQVDEIDCKIQNFDDIDIKLLKEYMTEIEKLLENLEITNGKNNGIAELYKTD